MLSFPNLLMIGGNSRNVGKTTLACRIISQLSTTHEVFGLKVTSLRPGEDRFHGNHSGEGNAEYSLFEESDQGSNKDTALMLQAGAGRVFYIRTSDSNTEQAIKLFFETYVVDQLVICESRSLREKVVPGIFIMMLRFPATGKPKNIGDYIAMADRVFQYDQDESEINIFVNSLLFKEGSFDLNSQAV